MFERSFHSAHLALLAAFALGVPSSAVAQCALPFQMAGNQIADASQMMANFQALARCIVAAQPGGANNAVQTNNGAGGLAGSGPLADGQLVIGATGSSAKVGALTAGPGISINNAAGNITIAATGTGAGAGLYRDRLSATPTSASTGLTTWLNQGTSTVADSAVGVALEAPTSGTSVNLVARYKAAPSTPYTITALIAATRNSSNSNGVGIGWYDGTNKLHVLNYALNNLLNTPLIQVSRYSTPTAFSAADYNSATNVFPQPIWLRIADDGTNVSFAFSQDGYNFLQVFTTTKAAGYLGATGYGNVALFVDPRASRTIGTIMSWTEN
jgi:hypothetical protein